MQRPTGRRRTAYLVAAATAMVVGFVEGIISHGSQGRLLLMLGFFALVVLTNGGAAGPPDA